MYTFCVPNTHFDIKVRGYELIPQTTNNTEIPQTTYNTEIPQTTNNTEIPQTTYNTEIPQSKLVSGERWGTLEGEGVWGLFMFPDIVLAAECL